MTIANYLYSLVYSDTFECDDWQNWGVKLIYDAEFNENTEWVYDIIFCNDKKIFFEKISNRTLQENYLYYNEFTLTEVIQGYYYIQQKLGKISLYKMLELSGDVADAGQDSRECEYFYELLNKIDAYPDIIHEQDFLDNICEYFEPLCKEALRQKECVENCTIEDLEIPDFD